MATVERIIKTSIGNVSISVSRKEVMICVEDKCSRLNHSQALSLIRTARHFIRIMSGVRKYEEEQLPEMEAASELEEVERGEREMEELI
jgi:hypothetical protein